MVTSIQYLLIFFDFLHKLSINWMRCHIWALILELGKLLTFYTRCFACRLNNQIVLVLLPKQIILALQRWNLIKCAYLGLLILLSSMLMRSFFNNNLALSKASLIHLLLFLLFFHIWRRLILSGMSLIFLINRVIFALQRLSERIRNLFSSILEIIFFMLFLFTFTLFLMFLNYLSSRLSILIS